MRKWAMILLAGFLILAPVGASAASITFNLDSQGLTGVGFVHTSVDVTSGIPLWTISSIENLFVNSINIDDPSGGNTFLTLYSGDLSLNYSGLDGYLKVYGDFGSDDGSIDYSSTPASPLLAAAVGPLSFTSDAAFNPAEYPFRFSGSDIKDPVFTEFFGFPPAAPWFFAMELPLIVDGVNDIDFLPTTFLVSQGTLVNTPVPEPGTMMLLGSGLAGLAGWGRKRLRR